MTATSTLAALAAAESGANAPTSQPTPTPALSPEASADAIKTAVDTALKAERGRLTAIDDLTLPGFEAAAKTAKESGMTAEAFAVATLTKIKADGLIDAVAALKAADAKVPPIPTAGSATGSGAETVSGEDKWKADFAAQKGDAVGFASEGDYLAFKRAEAGGKFKLFSSRARA